MTDAETLARLRASDMSPGAFLDALETLEETQEIPAIRDVVTFADMQESRDAWRFSCVASWTMWALTLLASCTWGIA